MSVSIFYSPLEERKYLVHSLETIASTLRQTFGDFPITLVGNNHRILLAMANVWRGEDNNNPYLQLAEALGKYEAIVIDVEY